MEIKKRAVTTVTILVSLSCAGCAIPASALSACALGAVGETADALIIEKIFESKPKKIQKVSHGFIGKFLDEEA